MLVYNTVWDHNVLSAQIGFYYQQVIKCYWSELVFNQPEICMKSCEFRTTGCGIIGFVMLLICQNLCMQRKQCQSALLWDKTECIYLTINIIYALIQCPTVMVKHVSFQYFEGVIL